MPGPIGTPQTTVRAIGSGQMILTVNCFPGGYVEYSAEIVNAPRGVVFEAYAYATYYRRGVETGNSSKRAYFRTNSNAVRGVAVTGVLQGNHQPPQNAMWGVDAFEIHAGTQICPQY